MSAEIPQTFHAIERKDNSVSLLRRGLLIGATSLALLATAASGCTMDSETQTEAVPTTLIVPQSFNKGCVQPTQEDYAAVQALFTAPTDPELASRGGTEPFDFDGFYERKAAELGLSKNTFGVGENPLLKQEDGYVSWDAGRVDFHTMFQATKDYLDTMDVGLQIGGDDLEMGARNPLPEELNISETNAQLHAITEVVSSMPVEVASALDVNFVLAVSEPYEDHLGMPQTFGGYYDPYDTGDIVLNISSVPPKDSSMQEQRISDAFYADSTEDVIAHELMHKIDVELMCGTGSFTVDAAFRALNPSGVIYAEDLGAEHPEYGRYIDREMFNASVGSAASGPSLEEAAHVVAESSYSLQNVQEDKATLGPTLLDADALTFALVNEQDKLTLWHKYRYMAARLFTVMPKYVEYMASITDHTDLTLRHTNDAANPKDQPITK